MIYFGILVLLSTYALASILPENKVLIHLSSKNEGLSEAQYHQVIDKVDRIYRPMVEKRGKKLTIHRLWDSPVVNAGATIKGHEWILRMYGGYARHPLITEDGYTLVMCHELGHHLGGAPKKIFENGLPGWPTNEGQADYFATLKCLREIFKEDKNAELIKKVEVPKSAYIKCSAVFKNEEEVAICLRTIISAMAVSQVSADIRNRTNPSLDTPDLSIVEQTFDKHPVPQCRLDTYVNGAICPVEMTRELSVKDETKGTCHMENGHTEGIRPFCWFKPRK
jgi:hypothetical protein